MAEQLGYCDSQQFRAAHAKCNECVNWRPIKSAPAPSPASERARSFRRKWSKIGDVEADAEMLYAFATQEVAAERKWREAVIEACVVNCIGWDESNPIKTLANLISWEVKVALDPKVSSAAQELIVAERKRVLEEACKAVCWPLSPECHKRGIHTNACDAIRKLEESRNG